MTKEHEGGDALIHLRVPARLKAKWVQESRADGKKLTDWIVGRVERMNVYKIPESLADSYHGAGWALAAVLDGQVVALRYIDDAAPAIAEQMSGPHDAFLIRQWLETAEAAPVVRELQALGVVSVGMCSSWEFVEQ